MQVLVQFPDSRALAFLDVLNSISFVKTKILAKEEALFLDELSQAVSELNLVKKGKINAKSAEDFLNEL